MPDRQEAAAALSGTLEGGAHRYPLRVYYADTDAGGVVYHGTYLAFAERARTEFLRLIGWDRVEMIDRAGVMFMVRKAELDYLAPARLDDLLDIVTTVERIGGASIGLRQSIRRGADELAVLSLVVVCVGVEAVRPQRLPEA
ncbi:MAG TPA: tol-pal system-associated acyl-CoA thioesterase, partial [Alphaproteobacteria bacterium]|nr:tol-pal system-associated acyl-CoA thioesterase [Alphaproteobacteria bacterium]